MKLANVTLVFFTKGLFYDFTELVVVVFPQSMFPDKLPVSSICATAPWVYIIVIYPMVTLAMSWFLSFYSVELVG